jgi:translation elongation factor EF-4
MLQGVVVYFRVKDGVMRRGDTVRLMNTKKEYTIDDIGVLSPKPIEVGCVAELILVEVLPSNWKMMSLY